MDFLGASRLSISIVVILAGLGVGFLFLRNSHTTGTTIGAVLIGVGVVAAIGSLVVYRRRGVSWLLCLVGVVVGIVGLVYGGTHH